MPPASTFSLNSTKTAIAIILPSNQASEVNAIRRIHDKAFHKWPPHVNILYPPVTIDQLKSALPLIRDALGSTASQKLSIGDIGTFRHRQNATVFLEPDDKSKRSIASLRTKMVKALGLSDKAGTIDGTFRPHLTLGQASLSGDAVDTLVDKCSTLKELHWEFGELAVLTRKPSGEMEVVDHVRLQAGQTINDLGALEIENSNPVWTPCLAFTPSRGWQPQDDVDADKPPADRSISVLSYNLLADTFGCSFAPRLPLIITALRSASKEAVVEVLCLQEVSSSMIAAILGDPYIRARYPYSSHSPESLLVSYLNLVTLSSRPFSFRKHHFDERHKSALMVRPHNLPYELANVHLSAALKDHAVLAKKRQLQSLTGYFHDASRDSIRHAVVVGDFNMATSQATIRQALDRGDISLSTSMIASSFVDPDVWSDAYLCFRDGDEASDEESGATFDVQRNHLAAESNAPADQRPQRYDRLLFGKSSSLVVKDFQIFGLPDAAGRCGSDHFGIGIVLLPQETTHTPRSVTLAPGSTITPLICNKEVVGTRLQPYLPSPQDYEQRQMAMQRLQSLLDRDLRLSGSLLLPLGSFALGTYLRDSDVDVLVIGSLPPAAFVNIARTRLATINNSEHELHFINSLVPVIETEIFGIKFDIQYCQANDVLSQTHRPQGLPVAEVLLDEAILKHLSPHALRPLNTYRDTAHILRTIPCMSAFRLAHRYLSLYLRRRGLYSARFGYLGGVHLTLMMNHLIKRIEPQQAICLNAETLVRTFIRYYAQYAWATEIVCDPEFEHSGYRRLSREPAVILAIHSPTARPNVASSCTRLSTATLMREFTIANDRLADDDWQWMLRDTGDTMRDFVEEFGAFIVLSIDMWNLERLAQTQQRAFIGHLESRVPALLVELGRIEALRAQAWPFQLLSECEEFESGQQMKVFYIIGVSGSLAQDASARKVAQGKLLETSRDFEMKMQAADQYKKDYMWFQTSLKSRKALADMELRRT